MPAEVPSQFLERRALAREIRESFSHLSDVEFETAILIHVVSRALEKGRERVGQKMFNALPANLLAGAVQETLYSSNLIADIAGTILCAEGRTVYGKGETLPLEETVVQGGAS